MECNEIHEDLGDCTLVGLVDLRGDLHEK
jgi:hypothetical protein